MLPGFPQNASLLLHPELLMGGGAALAATAHDVTLVEADGGKHPRQVPIRGRQY